MAQSMESAPRGSRKNGQARTALRARTNDVIDDFAELRKDMGRLAEAANKAARVEVRTVGHRLESLGRSVRERASEAPAYVSDRVREHPGAAIGVSLGAGLLIGLLLSRR